MFRSPDIKIGNRNCSIESKLVLEWANGSSSDGPHDYPPHRRTAQPTNDSENNGVLPDGEELFEADEHQRIAVDFAETGNV